MSLLLVLASIVFDGLDGWVARRLKQESVFGRVFDSIADFVSFALAPSFIYYHLAQRKNAMVLLVISVYICASAARLVRFNYLSAKKPFKGFEGLPTTASAGLLMLLIPIFSRYLGQTVFFVLAFIIPSVLMISRIHFWKLNN
jgi:CDP-diacylglycerol--serine O-phosphatidyltransferase